MSKKLKPVPKKTFKKRVSKHDIGYGVKLKALEDMGLKNYEYDNLDDMFGGNPIEEFDELLEDLGC